MEQVRKGASTPARVLLHGPGGCGKSVVVRAVATLLREEGHGVAIAAPTGCAAFLINGCTLHACLHLPVENNSFGCASDAPLPEGPVLQHLLEYWKPVHALIIDEFSMVSSDMWCRIDQRLQHFKRKVGVPFGGLHLLVCGDLYQLPPPRGRPAFAAQTLWRLFLLCELEGNHRAAKDPEYAELLERVRRGIHTEADIEKLRTRLRAPPAGLEAPRLLATRQAVDVINNEMLEAHSNRTGHPIHVAPASDISHATGLPVDMDDVFIRAEDTGGLETEARYAEGARVMLRRNLDLEDGLVNGARGYMTRIVTAGDTGEIVRLRVDFDRGGAHARAEDGGAPDVPINPVQGAFMNSSGDRIIRRQFPLVLSWAITIHKSQGATETNGAVVYLDKTVRQACQAYVALSRVQTLADLYLMAFEPTAIIPAVGVDHALLQLRLQQAYTAQGPEQPDAYWRACFAPAETADALEKQFEEAPKPAFATRAEEILAACEAEQRGDTPSHGCPHCGEMFLLESACKRHQRTCQLARRARKRPAAAAFAMNATDGASALKKLRRLNAKTSVATIIGGRGATLDAPNVEVKQAPGSVPTETRRSKAPSRRWKRSALQAVGSCLVANDHTQMGRETQGSIPQVSAPPAHRRRSLSSLTAIAVVASHQDHDDEEKGRAKSVATPSAKPKSTPGSLMMSSMITNSIMTAHSGNDDAGNEMPVSAATAAYQPCQPPRRLSLASLKPAVDVPGTECEHEEDFESQVQPCKPSRRLSLSTLQATQTLATSSGHAVAHSASAAPPLPPPPSVPPMSLPAQQHIPLGFNNLGNSCYLNAAVQALQASHHLAEVMKDVCLQPHLQQSSSSQSASQLLTADERLAATHFASMQSGESITPSLLTQKYYVGNQEDVQEFLDTLLQDSVLFRGICTGLDKPRLSCAHCGYAMFAAGEEEFTMLTLPLINSATFVPYRSIQEALNGYTASERVELREWRCGQADCQIAGLHLDNPRKGSYFHRLPRTLIVHLVRWGAHGALLRHEVIPDQVLNLQGAEFGLRSIICHEGHSARSGHYICFAKHEDVWWLYDDSRKRPATSQECLRWARPGRADKVYVAIYDRS